MNYPRIPPFTAKLQDQMQAELRSGQMHTGVPVQRDDDGGHEHTVRRKGMHRHLLLLVMLY